jgi:hypothetical protein
MILMELMSLYLNFSIIATLWGSFSFPPSNYGSMIFPFMMSNTLFLERIRSILVFHTLKLEVPSNFFSDFIE